ncbi:MAG TPA: NarK family nitrate/nitrite MFS transporter [Micromonosporaceae bacterium]|nr:NarK family nitrate/nitrite MFS transporter [Micromonosporaceae bacterium]
MTTSLGRGRWIDSWNPEDETFWQTTGRAVARRNLVWSIFAEHLGFSVWLLWSVVAVSLPAAGFQFSVDQLFWLVAVPNLVGAVMRIPYTTAVARFGGRNWTAVSAALLLVPIGLMVFCVTDPGTPYWMFLLAAATAGLGGGNFASSMANISFFYPERYKGTALGLNAAGGNLGVAVVQLLVPLVIGIGLVGAAQTPGVYLQNAPLLWLVPVIAAVGCAWLFMDNLTAAKATIAEQLTALRNKHTWVMSFLYIGTFGSFIGYSAAFPLLIKSQFPGVPAAYLAFLGPLVGSVARPFGGWLSDRIGGARITMWNFALMALGVVGVLTALNLKSFPFFLLSFLALFVTSGIGNGSTYRMIPAIFRAQALRVSGLSEDSAEGETKEKALLTGRREAAAVIGLAAAIGAFGGFLIPRGFGMSIAATGSISVALYVFLAGYGLMLAVTWWFYLRRSLLVSRAPSLAYASV